MNRNEFDKLEAIEQIEYINNKLMEGNTVTNVCKSIGIGRSTIRDRFEKVSHKYNKATNRYECIVEIIEADKITSTVVDEPIKNNTIIEDLPNIQQSSNLVVGTTLVNNEVLTEIINNYDENLNKLNEMYNWYKLKSSDKVVESNRKMDIPDYNDDVTVRSFKLYKSTQQKFAEFCKLNSKYKVQDILCYLLEEGMEKYK